MSDCYINIRAWVWHFQMTRSFKFRVKSSAHAGSVQIYPVVALELVKSKGTL